MKYIERQSDNTYWLYTKESILDCTNSAQVVVGLNLFVNYLYV